MNASIEETKDQDLPPQVMRRQFGAGLLAMLVGGLAFVKQAEAYTTTDQDNFAAANRFLEPYHVAVSGETIGDEDVLRYTHTHPGAITPCFKTSIAGDSLATHELFDPDQGGLSPCFLVASEMLEGGHIGDIETTHFHPTPRGLSPCFRTAIVGHSLAVAELFDAASGEVTPCFRVAAEMRDGGVLGAVAVTVDADLQEFSLTLGRNTYVIKKGKLALEKKK